MGQKVSGFYLVVNFPSPPYMMGIGFRRISRNQLYSIGANDKCPAKLLSASFGMMVNHESKGQKLSSLGGGGGDSNSRTKVPRRFDPKGRSTDMPERETQKVVKELVFYILAPKDAGEFERFMHSVGCCPSPN